MTRIALALVHYPCLDKHGGIYTTSITASRESSKMPSPMMGAPAAPAGNAAPGPAAPPRPALLGGTNPLRGRAKKLGT